jgi:hypothetical protein
MNSEEKKSLIRQKTQEFISVIENITDTDDREMHGNFQFDLAKEKLICVYNLLCEYQNQNMPVLDQAHPAAEPLPVQEQSQQVEEVSEQVTEEIPTEEPLSISSRENSHVDEAFVDLPEGFEVAEEHHETAVQPEMTTQSVQPVEVEENNHSEVHVQQPVPETSQADEPKQILSDKFQKDTHSFHQKFNSGRDDTSISSRLQSHPVPDLRKAIGINDRFSFITELFGGSKNDFELYLNDICALNSSAEILDFFANASAEKQWLSKPSFSKFRDLVQRFALSK